MLSCENATAADVTIAHELHRRRIFYSPWAAVLLARKFPALRFVADFSHFTVVCEAAPGDRFLDAAVRELIPHVHHVHARIGYDNGPQVCCSGRCPFACSIRSTMHACTNHGFKGYDF